MNNSLRCLSGNLLRTAIFNTLLTLTTAVVFTVWNLTGCSGKPDVPLSDSFGVDVSTSSSAEPSVFVILMENRNWSQIRGSPDAPYLNSVLLPMAAYAGQYYNPPGLHPSEPNYLWLEAGTNYGIVDDAGPEYNHQTSSLHLVKLMDRKGISWRSYQEDISGTDCPLRDTGLYAPRHNPMIFFDDVTDSNNPRSPYCIAHMRPLAELSADLRNHRVARYNFITPNLCNDMHGHPRCVMPGLVRNGDEWLAENVPEILRSPAWTEGGVVFITWDEAAYGDGPIGLIVLSPLAKGGGYSNAIPYTHSSLLLTLQEMFGLTPPLGDATNANDLRDLFVNFPQLAGQ